MAENKEQGVTPEHTLDQPAPSEDEQVVVGSNDDDDALSTDGLREPRLISGPTIRLRQEQEEAGEPEKASSAAVEFFPRPADGIWDGKPNVDESAPVKETRAGFEEYVSARPDIESREAILARENALPGQFKAVSPLVATDDEVKDAEKNADKALK